MGGLRLQRALDKEFDDSDVSGLILAADRPGFGALLRYIREGDTFLVAAIDRLGLERHKGLHPRDRSHYFQKLELKRLQHSCHLYLL